MSQINFDPREEGGLELVRAIVLERLRTDRSWSQYDLSGEGFDRYVVYVGDQAQNGRRRIASLAQDVLWEFMIQGIIAPGLNTSNPNFPWFRITAHGQKVLAAREFLPHDSTGYLDRFREEITDFDPTVYAYLSESLNCFTRGCLIASVVMLGVASERAFLLLCDSALEAIDNAEEKIERDRVIDIVKTQPKQQQTTLYAIFSLYNEKNSTIYTGDVYDVYKTHCTKVGLYPLTQRRVSDIIAELDMLGIINAKVVSKGRFGRTREISVAIPQSVKPKIMTILQQSLNIE